MVFGPTRHPVLQVLQAVLKLFYPRHTVRGLEQVSQDQPVVFICNHLKSYAPIVLSLYLPYRFRPWVQADVVSLDLCREYLEDDFVKKELHLRPPWSRWLASAIAPICVRLMKAIGAIPVFKGQIRIRTTFQISIEALRQGWDLVIFPESKTQLYSRYINDFQTGFAHLAWQYNLETGQNLCFHPVFVNSESREIIIGPSVSLIDSTRTSANRRVIARQLRNAVNEMAMQESGQHIDRPAKNKG
jgi:1-acyl-sn-glycerol-3-phosphate acyltransferase